MLGKHKTEVVKATQEHVDFLKTRLRDGDNQECDAALGIPGAEGMQMSYDTSPHCWTGLCDDVPVLMFGVGDNGGEWGFPWMLASDDIKKVRGELMRQSKEHIDIMSKAYPFLLNLIDARQTKSIRWLKWCGFTIEAALPWGVKGLPFHRFYMRREITCVLQQ